MATQMHVDILPVVCRDEHAVLRAKVSGHPNRRKRNGVVHFEVPLEYAADMSIRDRGTDLHDAFLRGLIFSAMEAGREITVHGNISLSLLENLETYQQIIASWWPEYRPVQINADVEVKAPADSAPTSERGAILAFSGGLDSIYSLFCHQRGLMGATVARSTTACSCKGSTFHCATTLSGARCGGPVLLRRLSARV